MKVWELIDILKTVHPEKEVVMSKDGEGNGYSPLADTTEMEYMAECSYYGYVGFKEITPAMELEGYGEEDLIKDGESALVLYPTN